MLLRNKYIDPIYKLIYIICREADTCKQSLKWCQPKRKMFNLYIKLNGAVPWTKRIDGSKVKHDKREKRKEEVERKKDKKKKKSPQSKDICMYIKISSNQ